MENYSFLVPLEKMPVAANIFLALSIILSAIVLVVVFRTTSELKQLVLGGVLYLLLSVMLMSTGQWKKPQTYYLKYEKGNIEYKFDHLNKELDYLKKLQDKCKE